MKKFSVIIGCGLVLLLPGCASGNKTDFGEEIDTMPAIPEAVKLMDQAEKQQADLLSIKEYTRAAQNLEKAQQGLAGGYEKNSYWKKRNWQKPIFSRRLNWPRPELQTPGAYSRPAGLH